MPLYEYVCQSCAKRTEVIQSFRERPLKICPHCGRKALKKAVSAPAIQFKGSGWYVTDYGGKKGAGGKEKTESESAKTEKKEKSAETKPETKKEAKKD